MDEDEIPRPWLACVENAFYDIFRNQYEAEQDEADRRAAAAKQEQPDER
jgi:hypothetical protein